MQRNCRDLLTIQILLNYRVVKRKKKFFWTTPKANGNEETCHKDMNKSLSYMIR